MKSCLQLRAVYQFRNVMRKWHVILLYVPVMAALFSCSQEKKAGEVAEAFLQAYYTDLDFDKVNGLVTDQSKVAMSDRKEAVALNPYSKDEIPNIVFKEVKIDEDNPNRAICFYTSNRIERSFVLKRLNGKWLVDVPEGVSGVANTSGMIELSDGSEGGFTSAASGPVTYKKKKK